MKYLICTFFFISFLFVTHENTKATKPPIDFDAAVPISITKPAYPARAVAKRISGEVTVDIKIDAAGTVVSARLVEGNKFLCVAAKEAALRWRFNSTNEKTKLRSACLSFVFSIGNDVNEYDKAANPYRINVSWNPAVDTFNH